MRQNRGCFHRKFTHSSGPNVRERILQKVHKTFEGHGFAIATGHQNAEIITNGHWRSPQRYFAYLEGNSGDALPKRHCQGKIEHELNEVVTT